MISFENYYCNLDIREKFERDATESTHNISIFCEMRQWDSSYLDYNINDSFVIPKYVFFFGLFDYYFALGTRCRKFRFYREMNSVCNVFLKHFWQLAIDQIYWEEQNIHVWFVAWTSVVILCVFIGATVFQFRARPFAFLFSWSSNGEIHDVTMKIIRNVWKMKRKRCIFGEKLKTERFCTELLTINWIFRTIKYIEFRTNDVWRDSSEKWTHLK